jgi:hypothetical protein
MGSPAHLDYPAAPPCDRDRFLFSAGELLMRKLLVLHRGSGRVLSPGGLSALVVLLCPWFLPLPVGAADFKTSTPTVVVRVHSLNGLLADLKHLAGEVGQGELLKPLEGLLDVRAGIDRTRPFGFYGISGNGGESSLVALVPVTDEKAFLDGLTRLGVKTEKGKGDLYSGELPGASFGLSFRFADGYVCATLGDEAALSKDALLPAAQVFPPGQARLVSAVLRLDRINDDRKRVARALINQKLVALNDQALLGDTAPRRELQKQLLADAGNLLESVLRDGRQLQVSFDLERRSGELVVELSLDGKTKSGLADALEGLGRSRSLFSGVSAEGTALHGLVNLALPENARKALAAVIDEGLDKDCPCPADLLKALRPSLKAGELDGVVSLQPPAPQGEGKPHTLLLGLKLQDGQAVDRAVRDLAKGPQGERIGLDADKAKGVPIHRVDVLKELGGKGKQAFGDHPAHLAFRADAVLLTVGENSLPALKEVLAAPPQVGPQVLFDVRMARLASAIALDRGDKDTVTKAAEAAFPGGSRDRLRFTLEGGPALKVRFAMNAAVLKFVGLLEKAEAEGK